MSGKPLLSLELEMCVSEPTATSFVSGVIVSPANEKSSMPPSEHRVVQIDNMGPLLFSPFVFASSRIISRSDVKAYPRSWRNRSVYSSNRWGKSVMTVAAMAPELDPETQRIGNKSNTLLSLFGEFSTFPRAGLLLSCCCAAVCDNIVLATPKWYGMR